MLVHTKAHPIRARSKANMICFIYEKKSYAIPKEVVEHYSISEHKKFDDTTIPGNKIFAQLESKLTKAGALLKGLRTRESLSQVVFAKKIKTTQANLSKMENGCRSIGKIVAKRIEKVFGTNYRYFLE